MSDSASLNNTDHDIVPTTPTDDDFSSLDMLLQMSTPFIQSPTQRPTTVELPPQKNVLSALDLLQSVSTSIVQVQPLPSMDWSKLFEFIGGGVEDQT